MSNSCSPSGCHANFPPVEPTKTAVNAELADYWDTLYSILPADQLEWFSDKYDDSLQLIEKCNLAKDAHILLAGCGNSGLIQALIELGYNKISAVDISRVALNDLEVSLGENAKAINFLLADFTKVDILDSLPKVDLWYDRMLLHHFTERVDQKTYLNTLNELLAKQGKVIVIENSLRGNNRSAGLPVKQFSSLKLKTIFPNFELVDHFEREHISPKGKRNYLIYGLFE